MPGYYDEEPMITKVFAKLADQNLSIFIQSDDAEDKWEALEIVQRLLERLSEKRRRFEPIRG